MAVVVIILDFTGSYWWIHLADNCNEIKKPQKEETHFETKGSSSIWKSPLAWQVALFMGLQSLIFYVTISWLTEILIDFGVSQTAAGFFLSYFLLLGISVIFMLLLFATCLKLLSNIVIVIYLTSIHWFS